MTRVIVVIAAAVITFYMIKQFYLDRKNIKEKWRILLGVVVFFLYVSLDLLGVKIYGNQIGHYFETSDYYAYYYVNFYTTETGTKNYKLKSYIYREEETGEYRIISAEWKNGGELTFDDQGYSTSLILNDRVEIYDDNNKRWFVELTNVKAE